MITKKRIIENNQIKKITVYKKISIFVYLKPKLNGMYDQIEIPHCIKLKKDVKLYLKTIYPNITKVIYYK